MIHIIYADQLSSQRVIAVLDCDSNIDEIYQRFVNRCQNLNLRHVYESFGGTDVSQWNLLEKAFVLMLIRDHGAKLIEFKEHEL